MTEISPEARMAVAAGFAYAGQVGKGWEDRLAEGVAKAAAAMRGPAAESAQEVLDSDVFKAVYRGYVLEESSTRLIVSLESETTSKSEREDDGLERIRTERTDTRAGKRMKDRLDRLPEGAVLLVFKLVEQMSGRGMKDKVRVLKHFEVLSIRESASSVPPSAPPTAAGAGPVPAPAAQSDIGLRLSRLSGAKAAEVSRRARAAGISKTDIVNGKADAEPLHRIIDEVEGWE
jgi:hypothetical protein